MSEKNTLMKRVRDKNLIDFFYLDLAMEEVTEKLLKLALRPVDDKNRVPFNAQLREYTGAEDADGESWIIKKVDAEEKYFSRLCQFAYLLDFELQTLSAPTVCVDIDGVCYRATKVVQKGLQISSYNYTDEPLRLTLANDLVNRWLMFDEDRNPNNYMVLHNSKNDLLVVAIDYNHSDLETEEMKITGTADKFGWQRGGKNRFLTLLKPSNFETCTIEDFEDRLTLLMGMSESRLSAVCRKLLEGAVKAPEKKTGKIISNILKRRDYINSYFRKWFKTREEFTRDKKETDYSGLGSSFVDFYKKKI